MSGINFALNFSAGAAAAKLGRALCLLLLAALAAFAAARPAPAIEIQNITTPKGVHAWFVEDKSVPMVSLRFDFKGGAAQDPADKQGLVMLMSGLLNEGAANLPSQIYQQKLDEAGVNLGFSADADYLGGAMQVLTENLNQGADLLAMALAKPRFDPEPLNRVRDQMIVDIKAAAKDPITIAKKQFAKELYGRHPYGRPEEGTPESLLKISRADLIAAHKKLLARDNVRIGIVGPLTKAQAAALAARIFDALPAHAALAPVAFVKPRLGGLTTVRYAMPQMAMSLVYPGLPRMDKDYYAAYLMNHILGGSGLKSRLFDEVREKRGLAYNVSSSLVTRPYTDALTISTGTRAEKAQQSLETIRAEVKKMAQNGVSEAELKDAKSYVIGSYAVQNMGSSAAIASILVALQDWDLPINYIDTRAQAINAVTVDQVNAVAKKLLSAEPAILMVGPMKD